MTATNYSFAQSVLTDAGLPTTQNNINNIARWMTHENSASNWFNRNNPLNASLGTSAADGTASYPDLTTAASYTAKMIRQSNMASIFNALAANASTADFSTGVCIAPWASSHYGCADAGAPAKYIVPGRLSTFMALGSNPPVVTSGGNVTATGPASGTASASTVTLTPIAEPPTGFDSDLALGLLVLNGTAADVILGDALVAAGIDLALANASTLTLTIDDPQRVIIDLPELAQTSLLDFNPLVFQLVSVDKAQSVLTVTFEPWGVAALRTATGAYTISPGTMTRTEFAALLVSQVPSLGFSRATDAYLFSLDEGYARNNQEQLSRGTIDAPLEDSWTCLQRLASEIQWVCFESFGTVYFGPYSYLTFLPPVLNPVEFVDGIDTIDGTYDVGQPLGTVTITAVAGSWTPTIGQCIGIQNLGPFNGNWLVSEMERENLLEPDITITLQQPLPGLPEPATGGATAAGGSGPGSQTTGGSQAAKLALQFCISKLGDPYIFGATGPNAYDCSGLVYEAYLSVGVNITRTTYTEWPTAAGQHVPPGINNLAPGDLVFFGPSVGAQAEHVGIVDSVNKGAGTVKIVEAPHTGAFVQYSTMIPTAGASYGTTLVYLGALRPSP